MVDIKKIEQLRIQHGYTQEQLAIKLGYGSKSTYNGKIKGIRQFTVEDVVKLCNLFQLELDQIIILEKVGK